MDATPAADTAPAWDALPAVDTPPAVDATPDVARPDASVDACVPRCTDRVCGDDFAAAVVRARLPCGPEPCGGDGPVRGDRPDIGRARRSPPRRPDATATRWRTTARGGGGALRRQLHRVHYDGVTWGTTAPPGRAARSPPTPGRHSGAMATTARGASWCSSAATRRPRPYDGVTWEQRRHQLGAHASLPTPPGRQGRGDGDDDSPRGVVVLFGGNSTASSYDGVTWEYDGTNWARRSSPPTRPGASLARSPTTARAVVVFGGNSTASTYDGVTWEYDGTDWTRRSLRRTRPAATATRSPTTTPAARAVLFGGNSTASSYDGVTWEYDGTTWARRTPSRPTTRPPKQRAGLRQRGGRGALRRQLHRVHLRRRHLGAQGRADRRGRSAHPVERGRASRGRARCHQRLPARRARGRSATPRRGRRRAPRGLRRVEREGVVRAHHVAHQRERRPRCQQRVARQQAPVPRAGGRTPSPRYCPATWCTSRLAAVSPSSSAGRRGAARGSGSRRRRGRSSAVPRSPITGRGGRSHRAYGGVGAVAEHPSARRCAGGRPRCPRGQCRCVRRTPVSPRLEPGRAEPRGGAASARSSGPESTSQRSPGPPSSRYTLETNSVEKRWKGATTTRMAARVSHGAAGGGGAPAGGHRVRRIGRAANGRPAEQGAHTRTDSPGTASSTSPSPPRGHTAYTRPRRPPATTEAAPPPAARGRLGRAPPAASHAPSGEHERAQGDGAVDGEGRGVRDLRRLGPRPVLQGEHGRALCPRWDEGSASRSFGARRPRRHR